MENENNNPKVILSRTSGEFLKRLFELNARDRRWFDHDSLRSPGERAKMAVRAC